MIQNTVLSSIWFKKKWPAFLLTFRALTECYLWLYLGIHYSSDIIFGIMLGSFVAWIVYRLSLELIVSV